MTIVALLGDGNGGGVIDQSEELTGWEEERAEESLRNRGVECPEALREESRAKTRNERTAKM